LILTIEPLLFVINALPKSLLIPTETRILRWFGYILCFILMIVAIGAILLPIVAIFSFIMVVIGAIKTNDGKPFSYPFSINLIK